ncbi:glycosyltransferase [Bifidobacterium thermacidophilum]|uniref:glycosyltransferase n=1 Tax=Bifidobacterium thermacidophilum TaxID=246618 RepID=UPI003F02710A
MAGTACDNGPKARNGAESLAATQNLAKRLAVVVVTYRRQHLLGELFDSLAELTTHPWCIYVVDNENSQDTQTRVRDFGERLADAWGEPDDGAERVVYLPQSTDVGGSAGFNAGMKRAYHDGAEWFWLMDDDVAVLPDTVETLAPWTDVHDVIQGVRFDLFGEDLPQPRDLNVAFGTPVLSPPRFGRAGYRVTNAVCPERLVYGRS